ncbi:MAG: glycosyltransferase family 2 protein, partial [Actinomycetota bacterium]|nr:glycosyltransferase family 2 protein [Actinomycetota bacterium]
MPRLIRLVRRAWALRHDREALLDGLDRAGLRIVPGAGRYENRSPRVGGLVNDAWAGHLTRSLEGLEHLAAGSGREARDATLALADWDITHHEPGRAVERLVAMRRLPRDGRTLRAEAERLVGPPPTEPFADLNRRLDRAGLSTLQSANGTFTSLHAMSPEPVDGPLVTVIVPAFNAADTIANTLTSLVAQSWRNLEIIVVDDASTDQTATVVESIHDQRITFLRQPINLGAYAARNRGLAAASGDYVTVNDADDWAHPAKIATQVQHLVATTHSVATASSLVRITHDLRVVRRGLPHGHFVGRNYASLMMHTERLRSLGGWDHVRVGADSELEARLTHLYGPRVITRLHEDAPLTLALSDASSLTGSSSTGLASSRVSTGARRLYTLASTHWHQSLSLDQPQLQRTSDFEPFPVPNLIRQPTSSTEPLDVIIWSDLALPGGTTASNLAEVAANEQAGWRTGLVHNRNPKYRDIGVNPKFFDACSDHTRLLSAGEEVSCDVLVIKYP